MSKKSEIIADVKQHKITAIVRGAKKERALKIARSLYQGGIRLIEVTFNTPGAVTMIKSIKAEFGNKMLVGAGTVLDSQTAAQAIEAGAEFILSPATDSNMITICNRYDKLAVPGVATPSEAVKAMQMGARLIKFFPAAASGVDYMKSIQGPLDQIELMAVGGINLDNASEFLEAGAVSLGIGSSLVRKDLLQENDFEGLTEQARKFVRTANKFS